MSLFLVIIFLLDFIRTQIGSRGTPPDLIIVGQR